MTVLSSLSRIEISVEPREPLAMPVRPAPWAIHAALHRLIERSSPTYAGRLHQAMPKPLSMTIGDARNSRVEVQLGLLEPETIDQVSTVVARAVAMRTTIEHDRIPYVITGIRARPVGQYPHAMTYRELVERSEPVESIRVVFTTPTTMRNAGVSFASIEPRHVFGSGFVQRWLAFAGEGLIDLSADALASIELEDGKLFERRVALAKFSVDAFTGWAVYTAPDGPARQTLAALAAFACFAGVGARTAYGLGSVELRPAGR